jgi:hypothetical protein
MKRLLTYTFLILFAFSAKAQHESYGSIEGIVYNSDSTETVPFSIVRLEFNNQVLATKTDIQGKYKFDSLTAGLYNLRIESVSFDSKEIRDVLVETKNVSQVDIYLPNLMFDELYMVGGCEWPPLAYWIGEEQIVKIKSQDLKIINIVPKVDMTLDRSSDFQTNEFKQVYARGSRDGDVIYIVNGIKTRNKPILPNCSLNEIQYYLGGVPAKYGDTTGGVIIIQTTGYFDLYYAWLANQ